MPVMIQVMAVTLTKFRTCGCSFTATFGAQKTQHRAAHAAQRAQRLRNFRRSEPFKVGQRSGILKRSPNQLDVQFRHVLAAHDPSHSASCELLDWSD